MGSKYAMIVAVERYRDMTGISQVRYAQADAQAVRDALVALDVPPDNIQLLVNEDATTSRVASLMRRMFDGVLDDDEVFVYYVGHGFSEGGLNYLTFYDTERHDKPRTSLALQQIFQYLRDSPSHKVALFLDACHSGPMLQDEDRGIADDLNMAELRGLFEDAEFYACFTACKDDQKSYSSHEYGHGIWTHYLLQAMTGNAETAIFRDGLITAYSLQQYLAKTVPLSVRRAIEGPVTQTPMFYGSISQDFVIADVAPLVTARMQAPEGLPEVARSSFSVSSLVRVKSLRGFRSGHTVPREVSPATENFVKSIAAPNLKGEADEIFQKLQSELGYSVDDIESDDGDGYCSMLTPDFEISVSADIAADDPASAVITVELVNITNERVLFSEGFQRAFDGYFDEVEVRYRGRIELLPIIRALEAAGDRVRIRVPRDRSRVEVTLPDSRVTITITDTGVRAEFPMKQSPVEMLSALAAANQNMLSVGRVPILPA